MNESCSKQSIFKVSKSVATSKQKIMNKKFSPTPEGFTINLTIPGEFTTILATAKIQTESQVVTQVQNESGTVEETTGRWFGHGVYVIWIGPENYRSATPEIQSDTKIL